MKLTKIIAVGLLICSTTAFAEVDKKIDINIQGLSGQEAIQLQAKIQGLLMKEGYMIDNTSNNNNFQTGQYAMRIDLNDTATPQTALPPTRTSAKEQDSLKERTFAINTNADEPMPISDRQREVAASSTGLWR